MPQQIVRMIDRIPLTVLVLLAMALGIAPVLPRPHLVEKLSMLMAGTLTRPVDLFDLCFHGAPMVLLVAKLVRVATNAKRRS
ncbi:MAG: RND transporter [Acidobacteriota bacterium]|nr:MAG: RND transporter [Acidobacteriota bacterium]